MATILMRIESAKLKLLKRQALDALRGSQGGRRSGGSRDLSPDYLIEVDAVAVVNG